MTKSIIHVVSRLYMFDQVRRAELSHFKFHNICLILFLFHIIYYVLDYLGAVQSCYG